MRRYTLSKKERRRILDELRNLYPSLNIDDDTVIEIIEDRELGKLLLFNNIPAFYTTGDKWIPHLKYLLKNPIVDIPVITVDKGAVQPLLRGADLMAPGIKNINGEFKPDDIVIIVDEEHGKPIVVGKALVDSKDIVNGVIKRGKVVENIHRIGDKLWSLNF